MVLIMNSKKFASAIEILFFPLVPIALCFFYITFFVGNMLFQNLLIVMTCSITFGISHLIVRRRIKEENKKFFISSSVVTFAFIILYYLIGVSWELLFVSIIYIVIALLTYSIRYHWKISAHMIGFISAVTIASFFQKHFYVLYLLIPLVGWCRLKLKRHDIYQVFAGSILGFVIPFTTFSLFF